MLEINKSITMVGNSKIGTETVKVFDAKINEANPENLVLSNYVTNYDLYKANRVAVTTDQTEFENAVYLLQEQLMAV